MSKDLTQNLEMPVQRSDKRPTVSVLMSVFNGVDYLQEAVDSVLNQDFGDYEFIIVDDGSDETTAAVLLEYEASDPRIKLIRRENYGLTKSLNIGISHARGDYLARMDGDDVCDINRLSTQVAFMNANPDVVAVGAGVRLIDGEGRSKGGDWSIVRGHEAIERELWRGHGLVICHPSLMVRTEVIRQIDGYDETYRTAQDLDLYLRLSEFGRVDNVPEILMSYRRHDKAVGHVKFEQQDIDAYEILSRAMTRRGIARPSYFMDARWENRRNFAIRESAAGNYFKSLRQAIVSISMRPYRARSWFTFLMVLPGSYFSSRRIKALSDI